MRPIRPRAGQADRKHPEGHQKHRPHSFLDERAADQVGPDVDALDGQPRIFCLDQLPGRASRQFAAVRTGRSDCSPESSSAGSRASGCGR